MSSGPKGKHWDKLRAQQAAAEQYRINSCKLGEKLLVCSHCHQIRKVPVHQQILTCIASNLGSPRHPGEIPM